MKPGVLFLQNRAFCLSPAHTEGRREFPSTTRISSTPGSSPFTSTWAIDTTTGGCIGTQNDKNVTTQTAEG